MLISVLLLISVAATLVTAAAISARGNRADASLELRSVQARAAADAGLSWVISALEDRRNPAVTQMLEGRRPVRWAFEGREIIVSLAAESGKVDLNAGDPDLVRNLIEAVAGDQAISRVVIERLARLRKEGRFAQSISGLLDPMERMGELAADFEAVFTVSTNLPGFDLKAAPSLVVRSLPGLSAAEATMVVKGAAGWEARDGSVIIARYGRLVSGSRPIYRAGAEAIVGGVRVRREALLVVRDTAEGGVSVVSWRDAASLGREAPAGE